VREQLGNTSITSWRNLAHSMAQSRS